MRNVKNKNSIIYNFNNGDRFIVINTQPGGHDMISTVKNDGLYYNNMSNNKGLYMISTMEENQKPYT